MAAFSSWPIRAPAPPLLFFLDETAYLKYCSESKQFSEFPIINYVITGVIFESPITMSTPFVEYEDLEIGIDRCLRIFLEMLGVLVRISSWLSSSSMEHFSKDRQFSRISGIFKDSRSKS